MEGKGQLYAAKVGGEVPAGHRHVFQKKLADFSRQGSKFFFGQLLEIGRTVDRFENFIHTDS